MRQRVGSPPSPGCWNGFKILAATSPASHNLEEASALLQADRKKEAPIGTSWRALLCVSKRVAFTNSSVIALTMGSYLHLSVET